MTSDAILVSFKDFGLALFNVKEFQPNQSIIDKTDYEIELLVKAQDVAEQMMRVKDKFIEKADEGTFINALNYELDRVASDVFWEFITEFRRP
jgi:hypothetical protein